MDSSFGNEQIEHLPQHQTVQLQPLPGAALGYRLTRALLWLVGLLVATAAVAYLRPLDFAALRPWLPYVLPAYACLHILWQYLTYRHSGYAIREHDVMYQRGLFGEQPPYFLLLVFSTAKFIMGHLSGSGL